MKRLLATIVAAGVIGASVMVSHAATLHVSAATLQITEVPADIDPPPSDTVELRVTLYRYSGNGNPDSTPDTTIAYQLPADTTYQVSFSGTHKSCPLQWPEPKNVGTAPGFGPDASPTEHRLCTQRGHTGLTVTLEPSGEAVQPDSGDSP